jgi:hypothetical protein
MDGSTAVSSEILETPEGDQYCSKHVVYMCDVVEIFIFKTFEVFKKASCT